MLKLKGRAVKTMADSLAETGATDTPGTSPKEESSEIVYLNRKLREAFGISVDPKNTPAPKWKENKSTTPQPTVKTTETKPNISISEIKAKPAETETIKSANDTKENLSIKKIPAQNSNSIPPKAEKPIQNADSKPANKPTAVFDAQKTNALLPAPAAANSTATDDDQKEKIRKEAEEKQRRLNEQKRDEEEKSRIKEEQKKREDEEKRLKEEKIRKEAEEKRRAEEEARRKKIEEEKKKAQEEAAKLREEKRRRMALLELEREQKLKQEAKQTDSHGKPALSSFGNEQKEEINLEESLATLISKLEAKKNALNKQLSDIPGLKTPLERKKLALEGDIALIRNGDLATIESREREIEKQGILEKEKLTQKPDSAQEKAIEQKLWAIEDQRKETERQRWAIEDKIEEINSKIKNVDTEIGQKENDAALIKLKINKISGQISLVKFAQEKIRLEEEMLKIVAEKDAAMPFLAKATANKQAEENNLEELIKKESAASAELDTIEQKEKNAAEPQEKRTIEQARWNAGANLKAIVQSKWASEEKLKEASKSAEAAASKIKIIDDKVNKIQNDISSKEKQLEKDGLPVHKMRDTISAMLKENSIYVDQDALKDIVQVESEPIAKKAADTPAIPAGKEENANNPMPAQKEKETAKPITAAQTPLKQAEQFAAPKENEKKDGNIIPKKEETATNKTNARPETKEQNNAQEAPEPNAAGTKEQKNGVIEIIHGIPAENNTKTDNPKTISTPETITANPAPTAPIKQEDKLAVFETKSETKIAETPAAIKNNASSADNIPKNPGNSNNNKPAGDIAKMPAQSIAPEKPANYDPSAQAANKASKQIDSPAATPRQEIKINEIQQKTTQTTTNTAKDENEPIAPITNSKIPANTVSFYREQVESSPTSNIKPFPRADFGKPEPQKAAEAAPSKKNDALPISNKTETINELEIPEEKPSPNNWENRWSTIKNSTTPEVKPISAAPISAPQTITPNLGPKPSGNSKLLVRALIVLVIVGIIGIILVIALTKNGAATTVKKTSSTPTNNSGGKNETDESTPATDGDKKTQTNSPALSVISTITIYTEDLASVPTLIYPYLQTPLDSNGYYRISIQNKKDNTKVGLRQLFNIYNINNVPAAFYTSVSDDFTLFIYSNNGRNRLGFVTPITNINSIKTAMESWEGTIQQDTNNFFKLLGRKAQTKPETIKFISGSAANGTAYRSMDFTPASDNYSITYAYYNDKYLLFATSKDSFSKIFEQLR